VYKIIDFVIQTTTYTLKNKQLLQTFSMTYTEGQKPDRGTEKKKLQN
jgi:hypothetical protein